MKDFIIQAKIDKSAFYMFEDPETFCSDIRRFMNIKERDQSMLRM